MVCSASLQVSKSKICLTIGVFLVVFQKIFLKYWETSRQDGGVDKHGLPPCTTTSKLQLNYRTIVIQNHQKLS